MTVSVKPSISGTSAKAGPIPFDTPRKGVRSSCIQGRVDGNFWVGSKKRQTREDFTIEPFTLGDRGDLIQYFMGAWPRSSRVDATSIECILKRVDCLTKSHIERMPWSGYSIRKKENLLGSGPLVGVCLILPDEESEGDLELSLDLKEDYNKDIVICKILYWVKEHFLLHMLTLNASVPIYNEKREVFKGKPLNQTQLRAVVDQHNPRINKMFKKLGFSISRECIYRFPEAEIVKEMEILKDKTIERIVKTSAVERNVYTLSIKTLIPPQTILEESQTEHKQEFSSSS